jgi:hypothetical protein
VRLSHSAPLLYHHHVGRFAPGAASAAPDDLAGGASGSGTGGSGAAAPLRHGVASAMLRAADEADTAARLRAALAREALTRPESESDSDDSAAGADDAADAAMREPPSDAADGDADDADDAAMPRDARAHAACVAEFERVMRERFLAGQEEACHVSYAAVDADAALDERWARVAAQDAEDSYFGGDAA